MANSSTNEAAGGLSRTFKITDITPEELAALFAHMHGDEQARFFAHVGAIATGWPGAGWCRQSCAISEHLDPLGTETILKLAEWANEPYVSPVRESAL